MDLWYSRQESSGVEFRVKVKRPLFAGERGGRRIDVVETEDFGKVLFLDGTVALTEADSASYREMAVHVPLNSHPTARSVLLAGGGDGDLLLELLRRPDIESVTVAEPESGLLEAIRRWFPDRAAAFENPKARLIDEDPTSFVRGSRERFDLIIVDRPEGDGPGDGGFGQSFYCDCFRILSGDGMLVHRAGGAFFTHNQRDLIKSAGKLKRLFPLYTLYRTEQPSATMGDLFLGLASKRYHPIEDLDAERWKSYGLATRYYNAEYHRAAFALPQRITELLQGV